MLPFAVCLIFLARGWLTWRFDSPVRELIWEEDLWSRFLPWFGTDWATFARTSDSWIRPTLDVLGITLMALAIVPWLAVFIRLAWLRWWLLPGTIILILDAVSRWISKDMQLGMALEYLLQVATPLALFIWLGRQEKKSSGASSAPVFWLLLAATAATFIGHGLYASGYYPPPLEFRMMTTEILPLSESNALIFLKIVGWLDFVVVLLLLIPRVRRVALVYMICWGSLTTLARLAAYFSLDLPLYGLDPWLAEALVRTPHWLIPLWLLQRSSADKLRL